MILLRPANALFGKANCRAKLIVAQRGIVKMGVRIHGSHALSK